MLNGDAHHSLLWEVELRIGRCRFIKDSIAAEHNRSRYVCSPVFARQYRSRSVTDNQVARQETHPLPRGGTDLMGRLRV